MARDGGLDQYKYLMDTLRTDTTRDIQFQRIYRSYWQMGAARYHVLRMSVRRRKRPQSL